VVLNPKDHDMQFQLLGPVLLSGLVSAGLYGFLPISIILSYRISRTIAFVHAGIAAVGSLGYWVLVVKTSSAAIPDVVLEVGGVHSTHAWGHRPELPPPAGLAVVVALGAVIGGLYGAVIMSRRVAMLPVLALTIASLGVMMGLIGAVGYLNVEADLLPPSPFGSHSYSFGGVALTRHDLATFAIVAALSVGLAVLLTRTHGGLVIRALADDQEAGIWCGVKLRRIGALVYAGSGAVSALAGALLTVDAGAQPEDMILLFLVGLGLASVGGMRSLPLAFCGALLFSVLRTAMIAGLFGDVRRDVAAVVLYGSLFLIIVIAARFSRERVFLLDRQSL
jgi:branched-subunit amino acid ABC-type transport system permease component